MTDTLISDEELTTMLTFYHDLGSIIYFGKLSNENSTLNNIVILDPQWLIDVFKKVITIASPGNMVWQFYYFFKV